ncbi:MAG: NifU family protein [Bacteroidetes bacterium]|nr:MAG: NifU family protein [Bacteroidota bacterium]TAG89745.1 MAG: NifU family protein [Bacteroidota bacterium]
MSTLHSKYITVYTEANPNPNSLKFVLNTMLVPEGVTFDFPDKQTAHKSTLVTELFDNFDFVQRVFVMNNFITVTKNENVIWHDIAAEVKEYIKKYFEQGKPLLVPNVLKEYAATLNNEDEPEINKRIKQILDEYIKPAVEGDGGAISFLSFENGLVTVQLQGACSGCPSSSMTLKSGIENLLKSMIPEVKSVVAENM